MIIFEIILLLRTLLRDMTSESDKLLVENIINELATLDDPSDIPQCSNLSLIGSKLTIFNK